MPGEWYNMFSHITIITDAFEMGIENIILIILMLGGLIFYAKDVKLGIIMHMLISGCVFMIAYGMHLKNPALAVNYSYSLIIFLTMLVLLALTLFAVSKNTQQGAII